MLALFLNHSTMFVAGEITLGLSLVLFRAALIVAVWEQASLGGRSGQAGHPNATIVRRFADERVPAPSNIPRPVLATRPVRSDSRRS